MKEIFEPNIILRTEGVQTSVKFFMVKEFTYYQEFYYISKIAYKNINIRVSFILYPQAFIADDLDIYNSFTDKFKELERLTENDKNLILEACKRINSPVSLPIKHYSGKSIKISFTDRIFLLNRDNIGSFNEVVNTYSRQSIYELFHALNDLNFKLYNGKDKSSLSDFGNLETGEKPPISLDDLKKLKFQGVMN